MSGKGPTVLQACMIAFCGAGLALFGCMGMFSATARVSELGVLALVVGLVAFVVGGLLTVLRAFRIL